MVQKIVVMLLLFSQLAHSATGFTLKWTRDKSPHCQSIIETFLTELRSMANDRVIEIEAVATEEAPKISLSESTGSLVLEIRCVQQASHLPNAVEVLDGKDSLVLRYLKKARGFDAVDWLPFQKKYLRPRTGPSVAREIALAPTMRDEHTESDPLLMGSETATANRASGGSSVFRKWWFWALLGGVGAGVYVATQAATRNSTINVEIH